MPRRKTRLGLVRGPARHRVPRRLDSGLAPQPRVVQESAASGCRLRRLRGHRRWRRRARVERNGALRHAGGQPALYALGVGCEKTQA